MVRFLSHQKTKTKNVNVQHHLHQMYSFISDCVFTRDVHLITESDAIRILKHSQWYDTLKIHMKQLPMRCGANHPDFNVIQHNAIQCNMMQWKKIWCYAIQYGIDSFLLFLWFRKTAVLISILCDSQDTSRSPWCCDSSYSRSSSGDERTSLRQFREEKSSYILNIGHKLLVTL